MTDRLSILWTAGPIATFLGVGTDRVYAMANEPNSPIKRSGGRLYAFPDELERWLRNPPDADGRDPKAA